MAKKIYRHGKFTGEEILTDEEHIQRQKDHRQRQLIEREESRRREALSREVTIKSYKTLLKKIQTKCPNKLPDYLSDVNGLEQLPHYRLSLRHSILRDIVDSELSKERRREYRREYRKNLHKTNWVWFFLIVFWPFGLYLLAKRILDKS